MRTFCSYLWEGIYVNRSGEVFACCHQRPVPYGNIHDTPLRELVNSPSALRLRSDSLNGQLTCYQSCNLLDKNHSVRHGYESARIDYNSLKRLHISFGEACNIRCVMCNNPRNHAANPILLDSKIIIKNVDLAPFMTIMLRGGEPLVLRPCLEFMDYLEKIGKRYTILTNGTLIDETRAQRLAEHAHSVIVSLNGATREGHESVNKGSSFERVVKNIKRMKRARDSLHSNLIIVGHMTITTSNLHEIPLFLHLFREFGFDRVNFGYWKETVLPYLASHPDFAMRLRKEVSAAMQDVGEINVDTLRLKLLGLWQSPPSEDSYSSGLVVSKVKLSPMLNETRENSNSVIGDPVLNILRELDHRSSVIAFIRHSERDKVPSPANVGMDNIPLTKRGLELAQRFGRKLPVYDRASVSHTSIIRSIQTATEIHGGLLQSQTQSRVTLEGKDSTFSVIYRGTVSKSLRDAYRASLRGQVFAQMWLDGDVPGTIMRPAGETIDRFLADIETRIRKALPGSIHIHVGHDREIEVVRTTLMGGRLGDFPMMEFLDGLVFYSQGEPPTRVRWRNCVAELRTEPASHVTGSSNDVTGGFAI